ncbi:MAG: alkaline phosphatase family protein [Dokdonella sp.]
MIISIVNRTETLSDEEVHTAIRAINKQIAYDFEPYWSFGAKLRLEGAVGKNPDKEKLPELRGDAIIYLWDGADVENALGYHDANNRGIPYGFIFKELCDELHEDWRVTLSHEALELLGDAQGNLLVQGPHPDDPDRQVFHWFEMCDAVQAQTYKIDGVEVANFLLPLYFTTEEQPGGRNDFLGRLKGKQALKSFGVAPGGYIGFFDPRTNQHDTHTAPDDKKALQRLAIKRKYQAGRGYLRIHGDATLPKEQEHQLALISTGVPTVSGDPIRHVVVLMLENRSFDQMLGDTTRIYPDVEGIPQTGPVYQNTSSKSGKVYAQKPNATAVVKPDPGHDLVDVLKQFGDATTSPMGGFVNSFLDVPGVSEATAGQVEQVMAYFPLGKTPKEDSLPALHALARNFLVCDHWFSSMPGPTWPNRFFAHSGTSLGHVLMPSRRHPGNMRVYNQDTIYDRLGNAKTSWRIYHDGIPQSIVLTHLLPSFVFGPHYSRIGNFAADAGGAEKDFPRYVFIEPCYSGNDENDQHPPSDVAAGDRLIADVYNAIRSNDALWKSTLLIVTYDEHGGFFDHVSPPVTIAPDANTSEYSFNRLGVRVPAILVSPWVERGVCKTPFDHTSILRYACEKWGLAPLGKRTDPASGIFQANSFASQLNQGTAREDTPGKISGPPVPKAALAAKFQPPVEGSREALLWFMANLQEGTPDAPDKTGQHLAAQKMSSRKGQALRPMTDAQLRKTAERHFEELLRNKQAEPEVEPTRPSAVTKKVAKRVARKSVKVQLKKARTQKTK